jgi:hypothetical protein
VSLLLLAPPNVFGQNGGGPAKIVLAAHDNDVDAASTRQKQQPYRLNADFSVQAEVGDLLGDGADHGDGSASSSSTMIITKHSLSKKQRVKWQMRRYRLHPTFGLLENKLLSHDLLDRHFGYPQAKVLYGAFARKSLGQYPQYRRDDFTLFMSQLIRRPHGKVFVLKPVSSGASCGVLVMDERKWQRDHWTVEKLADHAERFLLRDWSDYGQRYEHVGMVVQERLMIPVDEHDDHRAGGNDKNDAVGRTAGLVSNKPAANNRVSAARPSQLPAGVHDVVPQQIIEIKVHVVFGELAGGRLEAIPSLLNPVDIAYCGQEIHHVPRYYYPWRAVRARQDFARAAAMLKTHTATIRAMGKAIAELYGADWFRLDVFVGPNGWLYINEVTYPSHIIHNDVCTIPWYLSRYQDHNRIEVVESSTFWQPMLDSINVTVADFRDQADYYQMRHATDAEYEAQFWTVLPPEERPPPEEPLFVQAMVFCSLGLAFLAVRYFRRHLVRVAQLIPVGLALPFRTCASCLGCRKVRNN